MKPGRASGPGFFVSKAGEGGDCAEWAYHRAMNQAYPQPVQRPAKRNVGLLIAGILVAVVALGAGVVFLVNLNQYLSIEEKWANEHFLSPETRRFGVSLIKRAAFKRMTLFGPIAGGLGVVGVVLTVLGLRKK